MRNRPIEAKGQTANVASHAEPVSSATTARVAIPAPAHAVSGPSGTGAWPGRGWTMGLGALLLMGAIGSYGAVRPRRRGGKK